MWPARAHDGQLVHDRRALGACHQCPGGLGVTRYRHRANGLSRHRTACPISHHDVQRPGCQTFGDGRRGLREWVHQHRVTNQRRVARRRRCPFTDEADDRRQGWSPGQHRRPDHLRNLVAALHHLRRGRPCLDQGGVRLPRPDDEAGHPPSLDEPPDLIGSGLPQCRTRRRREGARVERRRIDRRCRLLHRCAVDGAAARGKQQRDHRRRQRVPHRRATRPHRWACTSASRPRGPA